jgi:hypothetical protein
MTRMCTAGHEASSGATWRCNLLAGHVGLHDDGCGDRWADDTTTDGPDRLQVAAVNLIGSYAAWEAMRPALVSALGESRADDAVEAIHGVLRGWIRTIPAPAVEGVTR